MADGSYLFYVIPQEALQAAGMVSNPKYRDVTSRGTPRSAVKILSATETPIGHCSDNHKLSPICPLPFLTLSRASSLGPIVLWLGVAAELGKDGLFRME